MDSTRTKSFKNIIYGILGQAVTIAIGLLIPRLLIVSYGSETNGLISSVAQIFAYVALLEAGVGGATLQALYKPLGCNDENSVSQIMSATDRYYKKTGLLYFCAVIILATVYPFIIESTLNYWVIFGVIIFNGLGGVVNYFFQGKFRILLDADGKSYITSNLATIVFIVSSFLKIAIILSGFGVVVVQMSYFALNVAQMLYITFYIKKHYKWLNLKSKPDYDAISQKNSVMVHQISALVFGNTDSIILTIFSGLKSVSVYSLSGSFILQISNLINKFSSGIIFSLGQNFANNRKKFDEQFNVFQMIYFLLTTFSLFMIYIFLNPFLALYTAGINDINYVDKYLPLLFVVYYALSWARTPFIYVIYNCAGHYKQTQKSAIIESVINIVSSIILVIPLGIYGVLLGTIIALIYRTNEIIIYSSKKILNIPLWAAYKPLITNIVVLIVSCVIGRFFLPQINSYIFLIFCAVIYAVVMLALLVFVNFVVDRNTFKKCILYLLPKKI